MKASGFDPEKDKDPWNFIRRTDMKALALADSVVAIVNSSSLGVGMEIQRALDKPRIGLNVTRILCLVRDDCLNKVSFMLRGVSRDESSSFELRTYSDIEDAKKKILDYFSAEV